MNRNRSGPKERVHEFLFDEHVYTYMDSLRVFSSIPIHMHHPLFAKGKKSETNCWFI